MDQNAHEHFLSVDSDSTLDLRAESETSGSDFSNMASPGTPLRQQLHALYEENITAKILKAAINGLDNNVSRISLMTSFQKLSNLPRTLLPHIRNMYFKADRVLVNTS